MIVFRRGDIRLVEPTIVVLRAPAQPVEHTIIVRHDPEPVPVAEAVPAAGAILPRRPAMVRARRGPLS
jgi:hypothetical protein